MSAAAQHPARALNRPRDVRLTQRARPPAVLVLPAILPYSGSCEARIRQAASLYERGTG